MPNRSENKRALKEPRSHRGLAALSIRALVIALVFWTAGEAGAQSDGIDPDGDGPLDTVETNTGRFVDATNTGTDPLRLDSDGDNWDDGTKAPLRTDPTARASSLDANSGKLLASDSTTGDGLGWSVALSGKGHTALVGARRDSTTALEADSAHVSHRELLKGAWSPAPQYPLTAGDRFGGSVSPERAMLARRGC